MWTGRNIEVEKTMTDTDRQTDRSTKKTRQERVCICLSRNKETSSIWLDQFQHKSYDYGSFVSGGTRETFLLDT